MARFCRQVRGGEHGVHGLDGILRFARTDEVRHVVQHGRIRPGFRSQHAAAQKGHGDGRCGSSAPGTAEGAPAGAGNQGEDKADEGWNGKNDVAVIRHTAHFFLAFRYVQPVRDVLDEVVESRSVRELHILAVRLPGQVLKAFRVEFGDDVLPAAVTVQAGGGLIVRDGGADGGADARRDDDELVLPGGFSRLVGDVDGVFPVAQDDQCIFCVRLLVPLEGLESQPYDVFQIGAPLGNPPELKLFNSFLEGVVVVGEGHDQNGISGEDDDAEVVARQRVQQVIGCGFCPSQA